MNSKNKETYRRIYEEPKRKDISFHDIETLLLAFGCSKREGKGSHVTFIYEGPEKRTIGLPKPHGRAENTLKGYAIEKCREFFDENGLNIDD